MGVGKETMKKYKKVLRKKSKSSNDEPTHGRVLLRVSCEETDPSILNINFNIMMKKMTKMEKLMMVTARKLNRSPEELQFITMGPFTRRVIQGEDTPWTLGLSDNDLIVVNSKLKTSNSDLCVFVG